MNGVTNQATQTTQSEPWWMSAPTLRSVAELDDYVSKVGFATLFASRYPFPALREAARDDLLARSPGGWGDDIALVWTWKDEATCRGVAWCGRLVSGKPTVLSAELLRLLYDFGGEPEDFLEVTLSEPAARVAEYLLLNGATSATTLRRSVCGKSDLDQARRELERRLLVTQAGVSSGTTWPSVVLELTSRAFTGLGTAPPDRDRMAADVFLRCVGEPNPRWLSAAFGWSLSRARAVC